LFYTLLAMREHEEQRKPSEEKPVFGTPRKKRKKHGWLPQLDALPLEYATYTPTYAEVLSLAKDLCEQEPGLNLANAMKQAAADLGYQLPPEQPEAEG
jgi:hypothetical protein